MNGNHAALAAFAHNLADLARAETLHRFEAGVGADDKGGANGFDPVTDADREAERAMRAAIEAAYPEHGIAGEEFPERPSSGPFVWSLDPVDGTRSFTCGLPNWVTLIALLEDGRPTIGLIDVPCLGERYWGAGGDGAFVRSGQQVRLRASDRTSLAEARLSTTDPYLFEDAERGAFERVRAGVRTTRYGHDGYAYARLAAGTLDLVIESQLKPYDYNALIPVVRAAGGVIGDWTGGDDFSAGRVIAAATPALFEQAVAVMRDAG
ncbi:inositol monophosphatase family protein [Sphingosinicella sp. BN140058]|uniref:inositol monophosphatase family protein n=1 Tax=Sphingosinicella sp. BN140058 TaxID=1892855 RepID=UPI0010128C98|nr:inositol monophosphatase family protein [Sphingosinicella sp. BN140058]QAY78244.1 inositol monophosphatase family protein [Sphingosinicella sp. BN140058]